MPDRDDGLTDADRAEIVELMRAARAKSRGYADFFGWRTDRALEETGVLQSLAESMSIAGVEPLWRSIASRGRGCDPPDCEAVDAAGRRVAIEVTELVDEDLLRRYSAAKREGRAMPFEWADWSAERFALQLAHLLAKKDVRFPKLKGTPYPGGYQVVLFTDEPALSTSVVEAYMRRLDPMACAHVTAAYLLLSYDPAVQRCPFFVLPLTTPGA